MSYALGLVPALCVGMQTGRSASAPPRQITFRECPWDVPTRSVGTRISTA